MTTKCLSIRLRSNDPSLTILNLSGTDVNAEQLGQALRRNTHLTVFFGKHNQWSAASLHSGGRPPASSSSLVESLACHPGLQYVYLSHNPLGDNGAVILAQALQKHWNRNRTSLQVLHLANCEIGARGAMALLQLLACDKCQLRTLDLDNNSEQMLGDGSVLHALTQVLPHNSSLTTLSLRFNGYEHITDPILKQNEGNWWQEAMFHVKPQPNKHLTTLRLLDSSSVLELLPSSLMLGLALNRAGRHAWGDLPVALWPRLLARHSHNPVPRDGSRDATISHCNVLYLALRSRPELLWNTTSTS